MDPIALAEADEPKCCNGDCRQGRDCPHKRDKVDFAIGHVLSFLGGIGFVSTAFLLGFWRIWK